MIPNLNNNSFPNVTPSFSSRQLINPIIDSSLIIDLEGFDDRFLKKQLVDVDGSDRIDRWKSINGTVQDSRQILSGRKPTYISNAMNNLPSPRFDGVDNYMKFTSDAFFEAINSHTIFIVAQSNGTQASPNTAIFGQGFTFSGIQILITDLNEIQYIIGNSTGAVSSIIASSNTVTNSQPFIISTTFSDSNFGGSGDQKLYLDRAFEASANISHSPEAGVGDSVAIGAFLINVTFTRPFKGDIGQILVYDRVLTDIKRQRVENYLKAKFKI